MKTKWRKHVDVILKEMHKRVNAKFVPKNVYGKENDGWINRHSWTVKEQDDFKAWLTAYLKNSSEARRAIMEHPISTEHYLEKTASWFVFDYGWRLKQ